MQKKVIATVGRLSPQKNHRMLINAFAEVNKLYPEYELHMYGDGEIRKQTEEYIHSLGLDGKVILKSKSNQLAEILPHAEIFAMSSDYEECQMRSLNNVYGNPVVTTAVSGTKELIENGHNGFGSCSR